MRPYFHMTDFEPATLDHAKLFAASYLPERHRAPYLAEFHKGNSLERLWDHLAAEELERLIWAEARIACFHAHLPYESRLAAEQRDRLRWDTMLQRHLLEDVEDFLFGSTLWPVPAPDLAINHHPR